MSRETLDASQQTPDSPQGPSLDRRRFLQGTAALGAAIGAGCAGGSDLLAQTGPTLTAREQAARFLAQATFGGDLALIAQAIASRAMT